MHLGQITAVLTQVILNVRICLLIKKPFYYLVCLLSDIQMHCCVAILILPVDIGTFVQ